MTKETNVTTTPMQPVSLPKNKPNDALSILALFGDLTDIGLDPCEELPRVPAPMTKPQAAEQEMIWSLDDIRREEMLFERALPALPEDTRYVSQAIGDIIQSWGVGRYVIDAGTGAGKTTAIMDLLKKNMTSCPRFNVENRKRILYLCNRKTLWEQIVQAILADGVERDFRDTDLVRLAMIECLSFEFVEVQTYQKLQKDYQEDPEKTLEHIKRCYTYIVCDEAHYFVNPISQVIYPEMNKMISQKDVASARKLSNHLKLIMLSLFSISTIFVVATHSLWLKYLISNPNEYVIPLILYIGYSCYSNSSMGTHNLFMALGYVKYNIPILLVVNAGYLGLLLFSVQHYGLTGVIATYLLQALAVVFIKEVIMRKRNYQELM